MQKRKQHWTKPVVGLSTMILLMGALAGCGQSSSATPKAGSPAPSGSSTPAKVISVRLGDTNTEDNPESVAEHHFADELKQLTNGQYDVKVLVNGVLGQHPSMNQMAQTGALEFDTSASSNLADYDPRLSAFSLPYLYSSREKLYAAEDGKLGDAYAKILEQYGFKVLGYFDSGSRDFYNRKGAINTPDDIKAMHLRIRAISNPIMISTINALGAQAVPMDPGEIYNAIQQGVVDGAENSVTFYLTNKHYEVAPYFSITNHFWSVDPFMVSLKWFNAQPKDVQDAIVKAGHDAETFERKAWTDAEQVNMDKAKSLGVKINTPDAKPFQTAVKPIWDQSKQQLGDLYQIILDGQ